MARRMKLMRRRRASKLHEGRGHCSEFARATGTAVHVYRLQCKPRYSSPSQSLRFVNLRRASLFGRRNECWLSLPRRSRSSWRRPHCEVRPPRGIGGRFLCQRLESAPSSARRRGRKARSGLLVTTTAQAQSGVLSAPRSPSAPAVGSSSCLTLIPTLALANPDPEPNPKQVGSASCPTMACRCFARRQRCAAARRRPLRGERRSRLMRSLRTEVSV